MKQVGDLKLYSVEDLSELLDIQEKTLQQYLRAGKIKGRKLALRWYVTEDALRDYFQQVEEEAGR